MRAAGVALAALLSAGVARADPPPTAEVTLAAGARSEALAVALRELLGRLGVRARVTDAPALSVDAVLAQPPRDDAVARVWIDLPDPAHARLFVVNARGDRVFVRTLALTDGLDEVARETVAHVVEDAVDALLHGAEIGVRREALRPPAPVTTPVVAPAVVTVTRAAAIAWRVRVGVSSEVQLRGATTALGAGVVAGASWGAGAWHFGATLGYQLRAAPALPTRPVAVSTLEHALRARAFAEAAVATNVSVELGAGGGVDVVDAASVATDASLRAESVAPFVAPVARADAALRVRVGAAVALVAGVSVEADLAGTRYVYVDGAATVPAVAPWALRPGVGVSVDAAW